ncbi:hypothetical protein BGZ73_007086 [Actinomortierella ambigua]|nr:hypothetical protein BGZ73_007086 [Actinomortierella ambigua]
MIPRNVLAIRSLVGSSSEVICKTTSKNGNSFLLEHPPGAYTGMRTIDQKGVLDFSGHVVRLANSLQQIHFHDPHTDNSTNNHPKNPNQPQDLLDQTNNHSYAGAEPPSVQQGLAPFRNVETLMQEARLLKPGPTTRSILDEAKITLLCTWDFATGSPTFLAHFEPLKVPMTRRCKVEVHGSPRDHATAKDSQWVRDRGLIEKSLEPDTNEALLMDDNQNIYEGLSSNFFAVVNGPDGQGPTVITAPLEYVLQGTIHRAVQAICKQDNIPLVYKFPNLKDVDQWQGAFVSSTTRLVLPIETMVLPDGTHKNIPDSPLVEQLRTAVAEECKRRVELVLD